MNKKNMYSSALIISLLSLLSLSVKITNVHAPPLIITIETDGSISPPSANITTSDNSTYTFTADMDASITVQRSNIVIDGDGFTLNGAHFTLTDGFILTSVSNVKIVNVTIKEFVYHSISLTYTSQCIISGNVAAEGVGGITVGVGLYHSTGNTVSNNVITGFWTAVELTYSSGNNISGNNVTADWGIHLKGSNNNTLSGNNVTNNDAGILLRSAVVSSVLIQSTNNTILGNNIINNTNGVDAVGAYFTTISRNHIAGNSQYGIALDAASNNTISENNIQNNNLGVFYDGLCDNNTAYHNNFIDNINHVEVSPGDINDWDDGVEGNYWSNYVGVDLDHDGIRDSWQEIDTTNIDHYPLMGMFHSFNTSLGKSVNVISNSTVTGFQYESLSTIRFSVSNMTENQTHGFCRVMLPHSVLSPPYNVTVNGASPAYVNYTLHDNGTHWWIYFEYEHSTWEIVIIPEFSLMLFLSLLIILTLLAATAYRRRQLLTK